VKPNPKPMKPKKTGFTWLLVHFSPSLQNGFTLQCLDLRKTGETEAGKNPPNGPEEVKKCVV